MTKMEDSDIIGDDSSVEKRVTQVENKEDEMRVVSLNYHDLGGSENSDRSTQMTCASCSRLIVDKYYLFVDNRSWHEECVQCCVCGVALSKSCFSKNCKLYCREDYLKLRRCTACSGMLSENERVLTVRDSKYHAACFACDFCRRQLQRGDEYLIIPNSKDTICCKQCYDNEGRPPLNTVADDSGSDQSLRDDDVFSPGQPRSLQQSSLGHSSHYLNQHLPDYGLHRHMSSGDKSSHSPISAMDKKTKRPRTILTTAQRRKFKASFEISQKPCRKVRETLAAETGLSPRVVQVWFQNQRAKMKKIARRQNQGDGSERGRGRGRKRKEGDSDSENDCSSPGSYSSAPTPRPYNDLYTSPGSMQTSPMSKHDVITGEFLSPPHHPGGSLDAMYDDFNTDGMSSSPYLSPHNIASTACSSTVTLQTLEHVPSSGSGPHSILSQPYDVAPERLRGNLAMRVEDTETGSMQSDMDQGLPQYIGGHVSNNNIRSTNELSTPMDGLIYMQNNYFRT